MFEKDIEKSLAALNSGGVLLYPTDTVWGTGCDATCAKAVERIYVIKQRCETRAMLALVDSYEMLAEYVEYLPDIARRLISEAVRPLTIIYPRAKNLAPNLVSDDGSIGIRIVNEPFCCELIRAFGKPIVSTSANISGSPTPSMFCEISAEVASSVDYVVSWRQDDTQPAEPSSIIKLNIDGSYNVIR